MSSKGLRHRAGHDPRVAALQAIISVLQGQNSQATLDRVISSSRLVPADKALCTELVYGLLRKHIRLQWFIKNLLPKPERLPEEMLVILELAAYELAHTRIPPHAGVDWAVELLRNRFGNGLSRVGNGVLRSFQRKLESEYENQSFYAQKLNMAEGSPQTLALYYALPEWLTNLWIQSYGLADALKLMQASSQAAPSGVRINPTHPGWAELLTELLSTPGAIPLPPYAAALPQAPAQSLSVLHKQGRLSRQSPAAYAILAELQPATWDYPIWDACAGRGNKTLALLEQGLEVASLTDTSNKRLQEFSQEFRRLQLKPPMPSQKLTAAEESGFSSCFATILADVPCSGLGTLAHRPEIRWRRTPEDITNLIAVQERILDAAKQALLPGGRIVYITCTLNPAENIERIESFCRKYPQTTVEKIYTTPPESSLGEFFWGAVLRID